MLSQHREQDPVPPSRINRSVPRDIETICLKALFKESARRYTTASALASDLQNYLDGKPISAKPISQIEKGARWISRNRSLAASLFALFAVLLVSSIVSTILWRNSENNSILAQQRNESLTTSLNLLKRNQQQLGQSIRSTYLASYQQPDFVNLPIAVRNTILMELVRTWRMLFERSRDNVDELVEMSNELLEIGEFTLENGMRSRSLEVTALNQEIADRILVVKKEPDAQDLVRAAKAWNQKADSFSLNRQDAREVITNSSSLSQRAIQILGEDERNPDYQLANIQSLESERLRIRESDAERSAKSDSIKGLLDRLRNFSKDDLLNLDWWKLEQQLLSDLTKLSNSDQAIQWYVERDKVLQEISDWYTEKGQGSIWYTRKRAVNAIFSGVNYDRLDTSEKAVENWERAAEVFRDLIVSNPLNPQLRADQLELSLIQANFEWRNKDKTLAIESHQRVLQDLKRTIQVAPNDHGLLKRGGQICHLIGKRYLELGLPRKAAETYLSGAEYADGAFIRRLNTLGANPEPERNLTIGLLNQAAESFEKANLPDQKNDTLNRLRKLAAKQIDR